LIGLQEWTTWILLALLVVWDLFAVLSPYGPLKHLLKTAKERNQNIEMLVYSVGGIVWLMSSSGIPKQRVSPSTIPSRKEGHGLLDDDTIADVHSLSSASNLVERNGHGMEATDLDNDHPENQSENQDGSHREREGEESEEDEESSGLKLGLGDFVFYSVLTARAALSDWVTTIACIVAVTTGMTMTIILLALIRKALPALPISITFGIVFYAVSSIALLPYIQMAVNTRHMI
jgi:presenilin 1